MGNRQDDPKDDRPRFWNSVFRPFQISIVVFLLAGIIYSIVTDKLLVAGIILLVLLAEVGRGFIRADKRYKRN